MRGIVGTLRATVLAVAVALSVVAGAGCAPPADRSPVYQPTADGPDGSAGPRVRFPWQPGRPELGVQVYWNDNPDDSPDVVRAKARRVLDYVVGLEANAVSIAFPLFTDQLDASLVTTGATTPTPQRLGIVLAEVARTGLRTTIRPLIDEERLTAVDPHAWRGDIEPSNRDEWFASYRSALRPYLALAREQKVSTVIVASELSDLEGDPRWQDVVGEARTEFGGEVTYAYNWDAFVETQVPMPVDRVGVDAYPILDLGDDATIGQLVAGWNGWLDRRISGSAPDLIIYEVGAPAEAGLYLKPSIRHTDGKAVNQVLQARWFTASCTAAQGRQVAGLYWWKVDFHANLADADPLTDRHDSFIGRAAENSIRSCFSSWEGVR